MYRRIGRYQPCRPTSSTLSPTHTTPRNVSAHRPLSTLPSNLIHYITYTRHATRCIGVPAAINTAVQPHPLHHLHTTRHAMYRRIGRYQHCRPTASTTSPTHTTPRNVSAYRPLSTLPSNRIHSITYTRHATRCIGVSAAINTAVQPHPLYHLHAPRHAMYRRIGRYQHCRPTASTLSPTHTTPRNVSAHRPLSAFITQHGLSQRAGLVLVCPVLSAHLSGGANSAPPDHPRPPGSTMGRGGEGNEEEREREGTMR